MIKRLIIFLSVILLATITLIIYYNIEEESQSIERLALPLSTISVDEKINSPNFAKELQLKFGEVPTTPLPEVEPFLAHQFKSTKAPLPVILPSRKDINSSQLISTPLAVDEASNPVIEGLKELAQAAQIPHDSSRVFGLRDNSGTGQSNNPSPTEAPLTTATPINTLKRVAGLPSGYTMLYLMHPKARNTVEHEIKNMLDSNIKNLYLGALIDGTFSESFTYLESILRRLNQDGRELTLVLYITNGATMRRFDTTPINTPFSHIDPNEFRGAIRFEPNVRNEYYRLLNKAKSIFDLNRKLNIANTNIAIVMLEDNLDQDAFRAMRDMARTKLSKDVAIMRNPCPGCYPGNDTNALGGGYESHTPADINQLGINDGFSLDGIGMASAGEDFGSQLSPNSVRKLKDIAVSRNIKYFGLWRKERQGLGDASIHPDDRVYEVPSDEQSLIEIDLLRHGLL